MAPDAGMSAGGCAGVVVGSATQISASSRDEKTLYKAMYHRLLVVTFRSNTSACNTLLYAACIKLSYRCTSSRTAPLQLLHKACKVAKLTSWPCGGTFWLCRLSDRRCGRLGGHRRRLNRCIGRLLLLLLNRLRC
jgi:hypothetical protein